MTTDEVRTTNTSGGGGHSGQIQNIRTQMVNQNTPQVVNTQTGQQVIQYIPQSPQPTGNFITIMPTNAGNWSNQVIFHIESMSSETFLSGILTIFIASAEDFASEEEKQISCNYTKPKTISIATKIASTNKTETGYIHSSTYSFNHCC